MAKYKATKSFSGIISMKKGDEREINDEELAKDLLQAGFVIALESEEKVTVKKAAKKSSKKDEDGDSNG